MYIHFYRQEEVDKYLESIRDGKIDIKDVCDMHRSVYDYSKGSFNDINPHYIPSVIAIDCKTIAGTGVLMIVPNIPEINVTH